MNKFLRWPTLVILVALIVAALVSAIAMRQPGRTSSARAAGITPSITVPAIIHPFDTITITGQGFAPGDSVVIVLNRPNNGVAIMTLSCDSNGNCSGQGSIPYTNVPQGTYQINATGSTGLTAQASIAIAPGIALTPPNYPYPNLTAGGPGTAIQIIGGGFVPGESLNINWGGKNPVFLGSATVNSYDETFSLEVHAPAPIIPGYYPIDAMRTNQTPARVSTVFHVLPVRMVSSAGILASQPAHIRLSGFQASEQVALSWNANNNQTITTLTVDGTGALDTYVPLPSAPKGAYTLQALGNTSQLHAQSNLNIGPGILLSLNTENPGGTTTVSGGGYTPGETVDVYFQSTSNGVTMVPVDATGAFSISLAIPVAHKQDALYFVYAVSTTTSDSAKAQFFYATPAIQLQCCYSPTYGLSFTVTGSGFAANDTVTIAAKNIVQQVPVKLGTATTAADGTFTFTSTMPGAPYVSPGPFTANMLILARGTILPTVANTWVLVKPNIIPTPGAAHAKQIVFLKGGGFGSNETVTIQLQNTSLGTATTDANGSFFTKFVVPTNAQPGNYFCNLCVTGETSHAQVWGFLVILPVVFMSPNQGPSGTVITLKGYGISPGYPINIYWFDPGTNTQTLLTSFMMNGYSFVTKVTAPANLTSGNTYYIQVQDFGGLNIQFPFQAT